MNHTPEIIHHPPLQTDRVEFEAPVLEVTLFEDQAQIRRRGSLRLSAGPHRLRIGGVAPVLQDVSLRAAVVAGQGRVADAHVRRAIRVLREHKPADVQALDHELRELRVRFDGATDARDAMEHRLQVVEQMLGHGAAELSQDVAWGQAWPDVWRRTFGALFDRAHELETGIHERYFEQQDLARDLRRAVQRRRLMERPDQHFLAVVDLDVFAEAEEEYSIEITYIVPNALWRPIHSARLEGDRCTFQCRAAVWQNTGEAWSGARLTFSTARTSLGTDPPLLSDDLLTARRKAAEVRVEARQVDIQQARVAQAGPAAPPSAVDLPGVDDGGDVQNIPAPETVHIASDGRPTFIDLFAFEAPAQTEHLAIPELNPCLFLRAVLHNGARHPILAGPVELIRDTEVVGWTQTNFVAPTERFELSFGPDHDIRIHRHDRVVSEKVDEVDKWRRRITEVRIYLSNLGDTPRLARVRERIPVSEIEHVRVSTVERYTRPAPAIDDNGFCTWDCQLGPHDQQVVQLRWELALAPDVQGM